MFKNVIEGFRHRIGIRTLEISLPSRGSVGPVLIGSPKTPYDSRYRSHYAVYAQDQGILKLGRSY